MSVILTYNSEIETWMTPAENASGLQRPLNDEAFRIVASSKKEGAALRK
jgi:putative SOS response-associated peptidase YedK